MRKIISKNPEDNKPFFVDGDFKVMFLLGKRDYFKIDLIQLVSSIRKCSRSEARRLLEQGALHIFERVN